jgi:hypothetical protein
MGPNAMQYYSTQYASQYQQSYQPQIPGVYGQQQAYYGYGPAPTAQAAVPYGPANPAPAYPGNGQSYNKGYNAYAQGTVPLASFAQ